MNRAKMIQMAERNLNKAKKAQTINYNRQGITESERENLSNNVEYAKSVYDLIVNNFKEE